MSAGSQTLFYAKTWHHCVITAVFSFFAASSAIIGPLFLFGVLNKADGTSAFDAGIALTVMAVPMTLLPLFGWFNVVSRQKPLLRIGEDGIHVTIIGGSISDGVPLMPPMLVWLTVSMQGFKQQLGFIPWEMYRGVKIAGVPMQKTLFIDAAITFQASPSVDKTPQLRYGIAFIDADFQVSLETVASTMQAFYDEFEAKRAFPVLNSK